MDAVGAVYEVGFKDVYPWVWSVMLGVALTLAERRGAFQTAGTHTVLQFWAKNASAVVLNLALPALIFGITMTRLGPLYSRNMDFWQILGALYLAGVPLGTHHVWLITARKCGWLHETDLTDRERLGRHVRPIGSILYALFAFGIPTLAALIKWRIPY